MLTDHLGSTSLITNATGGVISETRYSAWGEVRVQAGSEGTKYQFTGQYSYASDFGLLYYNARWYDPALSRFAQADSIVPGGVQGYDRYAYVNNNPVRYTDPSGHDAIPWNTFYLRPSAFLRVFGGVSIGIGFAVDLRPIKNLINSIGSPESLAQSPKQIAQLISDSNVGLYLETSLSVGIEVAASAGVSLGVTTTTMEELAGITTIANELSGHGEVCYDICLGAEASDNYATPDNVDTAGIFVGIAPPVPAGGSGVDLINSKDWIAWGRTNAPKFDACIQAPFTEIGAGKCPE